MRKVLSVAKALSDSNRLRTMMALSSFPELCACELGDLLQVTSATISRHMDVLLSAGLISSRKDGRWVYYRIAPECMSNPMLAAIMDQVRSHLREDPQFIDDLQSMKKVTCASNHANCAGKAVKRSGSRAEVVRP